MVRAAIGREFISVVASREQIGEHLDRLFGSDQGEQRTDPAGQSAGASTGSGRATPDAEADSDTANVRAADADESLLTSDDIDVGAKGSSPRHDEPKAKRRTTKKSVDRAVEDAESLDLPADPSGPPPGEESVVGSAEQQVPSIEETINGHAITSEAGASEPGVVLADLGADPPRPEVLTAGNALATTTDDLAELAKSVQDDAAGDEEVETPSDSTALAADLVAEAVATFQEQHSDEEFGDGGFEAPTATSLFPPLAKSLVDGERVLSRTWRPCSRSTTAADRASLGS